MHELKFHFVKLHCMCGNFLFANLKNEKFLEHISLLNDNIYFLLLSFVCLYYNSIN